MLYHVRYVHLYSPEWGRGELSNMGFKEVCLKGYGFSAVLVINRVWFLHSCPELGMFCVRRSYFFIVIDVIKSLSKKLNLGQLCHLQQL